MKHEGAGLDPTDKNLQLSHQCAPGLHEVLRILASGMFRA